MVLVNFDEDFDDGYRIFRVFKFNIKGSIVIILEILRIKDVFIVLSLDILIIVYKIIIIIGFI